MSDNTPDSPTVLLTGATGYIGGRLLDAFEEAGTAVRCLTRRPDALAARVAPNTEVRYGDVLKPDSLLGKMDGINTAYYLIHSMGSAGNFEEQDRAAALAFGAEAKRAGVERIIYLGGLGDEDAELSSHLRSRIEVGNKLRASGVNVVEFRASIVIGSGSLSFEMIRALVERLPVMITPRWVDVVAQPIAVTDLIGYLLAAHELASSESQVFEIGGTEIVSYGDLMREYARQRSLRRVMVRVPFLTPHLSSLWLGLVTPLYARIGRKLINSIRHPTIVTNDAARRVFPQVETQSVAEAISLALRNEEREFAQTRWSDALSAGSDEPDWGGVRFGNRLVDSRTTHLKIPPSQAFKPIRRIGGKRGWYYGDWLWKVRGFLDLLFGGVGVRRGRRNPEHPVIGDTLDFWRVEAYEPDHRLRLKAEMLLPGRAWLEFEVTEKDSGSLIRQTAIYDPVGLFGLLYWYSIYPLHQFIFNGMLQGIAEAAQSEEREVRQQL